MRKAALALVLAATALVTWSSRSLTTSPPDSVYLEDLTWVEVRELIKRGKTIAIVPTAGLEQNGPHMVLGKHGYIVRHLAERIAKRLGNALVAPVLDYVPEGPVDPPQGHMRFAGTISIPEPVFASVLEHAARSLRAHGFTTICFLGDSGGNQKAQAEVAERLNLEWAGTGTRVLHLGDYYARNGQTEWLLAQGETVRAIGTHAGIRDTSELLAVSPKGVRPEMIRPDGGFYLEPTGVHGDPTRASARRGETLLQLKVEAALRQIHGALAAD